MSKKSARPICAVESAMADGAMSHEDALAEVRRRDAENLARYGWVAHLVFDDPDTPFGMNLHTHGLPQTHGHPDFQIVLPLPNDVGHAILATLADSVEDGLRFEAGASAPGIIDGFDVGFAWAVESGRDVLRVILPDPEGNLWPGSIREDFAGQFRGTTT